MKTDGNAAAFPFSDGTQDGTGATISGNVVSQTGLTKREIFAAFALMGILARGTFANQNSAELSVDRADRLIEALNRGD